MQPNILNPAWKYTKAIDTNISRTFAKVRKELAKQREVDAAHERIQKVRAIR